MDTPAIRAGQLIQRDGSASSEGQWREPLTFGSLPERQLDLPELLRLLRRQQFIVIGTMLVLTAAATVFVFSLNPIYTATSTVMLDPREEHVIDIQSVIADLPQDAETVQTEIEVLRSRDLAARVITQLELHRDTEFNPTLADPGEPGFPQLVGFLRDDVSPRVVGMSETLEAELAIESSVVDNFLKHLDVAALGESRAITISFSSGRPTMAAKIANAVADHYLAAQLDTKRLATERANQWLEVQLEHLRERAEKSLRKVESLRKESGLLLGDKEMTFPTQEVSQLIEQVVVSQAERASAQADLLQAEAVVAGSADIDAVPQVLDSDVIQSLRQQEALLSANLAQLSTELGTSHPTLLTVRRQLQDVRTRIGAEMKRIVVGLRNRLDAAQMREVSLSERLNALKSQLGDVNQAQAELKILGGEAVADQMLFETFLQRFNQTGLGSTLYEADARIISHASVPAVPSFPKKKMLIALSLAISGLVGIVLAFLNESRNESVRSTEELEVLAAGISTLGIVPVLKRRWRKRPRPENYVLTHRRSAFAESLRNLDTGLSLANGGGEPQSILLASSVPGEGKSTIALSLARLIASTGRRVIVVDADLHRAQIHQIAGLPRRPGLGEVLAGKLQLAEAIRPDPHSSAFVLPAGGKPPDTAALIAGKRMSEVMAELRQAHDLIIVDSAPLLAVVDTRLLCRLVDKTVFLVRWERTRRKTAEAGLRQIRDANGDLGGVLLTCVDVRKYAHYGFGDSGNYHGALAKYYMH